MFPIGFPESIKGDVETYNFSAKCEKEANEDGKFPITFYTRYDDNPDYDSVFFLSNEDVLALSNYLADVAKCSKEKELKLDDRKLYFSELGKMINKKEIRQIYIQILQNENYLYNMIVKYSLIDTTHDIHPTLSFEVDMGNCFQLMARNIITNKREKDLSFISASGKKEETFEVVLERQFILKLLNEMDLEIDHYTDKEFDALFDFFMTNDCWLNAESSIRSIIEDIKKEQLDILENFDKILSNKDNKSSIHFSKPIPNEKITQEDFNSILNGFKEECLSKEDSK